MDAFMLKEDSMKVKTELLSSLQAHLPATHDGLDLADSIIIEDEHGGTLIVGSAAERYAPDTVKRRGGQPAQGSWRNFLRAAVAHSLGEGQHEKTVGFSAAASQIEFFRGKDRPGVKTLTEENYKLVRDAVKSIRFKHDLNEAWKTCELTIKETPVVNFEAEAVVKGLPDRYQTYLLWQLGFGDWQQLAMIDGRPEPTSMTLIDGVSGAYEIFEQRTGLSKANVRKAWSEEKLPEKNAFSGAKESAVELIYQCLRSYFHSRIGFQLNKIDKYRDRIAHIVLSGGSSKDNKILEVIGQEVEAENFRLIPIQKIMEQENLLIKDPVFATILGLIKQVDFAIDIGNSYIKTGVKK